MTTTNSDKSIITKKELKKGFWRSFTTSHAWHYERQQHMAFCYSMIPFINKLYTSKEERSAAYKRHMEFYNCNAVFHPFIMGVTAAMEEENAKNLDFDTSSIGSVKVALMGPLAGIGDSLLFGTLRILATGIVAGLCTQGSIMGPILFLLMYNIPTIALRYLGVMQGFKLGSTFIRKVADSDIMKKVTMAASIIGLMVIGAMVANLVSVTTPISFGLGESSVKLQETLDSTFPKLLPLLVTGIIYKFTSKKVNILVLLLGIMISGILLGGLGILG